MTSSLILKYDYVIVKALKIGYTLRDCYLVDINWLLERTEFETFVWFMSFGQGVECQNWC